MSKEFSTSFIRVLEVQFYREIHKKSSRHYRGEDRDYIGKFAGILANKENLPCIAVQERF